MNRFFPWIGGKKLMREVILERFPHHDRYVEVFGGATWVLFAKAPEPFEVYNDFNSNLVNLFSVVKQKPMAFLQELGFLPLNRREEFQILLRLLQGGDFTLPFESEERKLSQRYLTEPDQKEWEQLFSGKAMLCDVRRAITFYKLIRYSYAGNSTSFNNQPTNIMQICRTIWLANRRLNENGVKSGLDLRLADGTVGKGVIIENRSYETLIPLYDRVGTLFYCDPPYFGTESMYQAQFLPEDIFVYVIF